MNQAMFRGVCLGTLLAASALAQNASFETTVQPFLKAYCLKCHGADQQEGDRRFDKLANAITTDAMLVDYQDILDQLNLSAMPPEDEPQPTNARRQQIIDWLTTAITKYHATRSDSGSRTALRRLNAREYRNTVRDLLKLDMTMFDPTTTFPKDQTIEHRDNDGATLVTSGYLLAEYLKAAELSVSRALYPLQRPETRTRKFDKGFKQQPEIDQVHRKTNQYSWITLYDVPGADKPEGAYGYVYPLRDGVSHTGVYEIRLKAEALNRDYPYDEQLIGIDKSEPFRLGIVAGTARVGDLHRPQPVEPKLAEFELADEPKWYSARVQLDEGYTPRFTFPNGMMDVRNMWGRVVKRYRDRFPDVSPKPGIVEVRFKAIKFGHIPQIRIHEVEIKGPIFEQWPTPSQKELLGEQCEQILESGALSLERTRTLLGRFARRAYRREPVRAEIDRVMKIVERRRQSGRTPIDAFADGVKAILISPHFLYHGDSYRVRSDQDTARLTGQQLACRLSYFLWSTAPDEALMTTARFLNQPSVMRYQLDRMLNDSRSNEFVNAFLDSWLTLRDLGSQPPDRRDFNAYYRYDLGAAMKTETRMFFRHLIDEDLAVSNLLDSDFTFVNKPLARHYGLPVPAHSGFQKVSLTDKRRGGLLGQGSVLTVTANGIDTSPIIRGVWLLDNIMGTPPPPPPPDVEPLDPDIRGAKTIRDQLKKHRETPSCYSCHRKIDPPGFALENFDPIGRWRTHYPLGRRRGPKIDASGELAGGKKFNDVRGLKQQLLAQQDQFTRSLAEKLLAYGTGRPTSAVDRPAIDRLLKELKSAGGGMRTLLRLVVQSEVFAR